MELSRSPDFHYISSELLLAELRSILRRKSRWDDVLINEALSEMRLRAEVVNPAVNIDVCRDPDDNRVLECAVTGKAHAIITGDRDLLDLGEFRGIRIQTVSAFLETIAT